MTTLAPSPSVARPTVGFVRRLGDHGEAVALRSGSNTLTYAALSARVGRAAAAWADVGIGRRLVLLELTPSIEAVLEYLGALLAGHAVVIAPPGRADRIVTTFDPDTVGRTHADGIWRLTHRRAESSHRLHDDLALLLSTSGSTGSPKLARLAHTAVDANTEDIVDALGTRPTDVVATTLPLHYCYGLSVLHTHLAAGAEVVLTDASLVDDALWELMRSTGVTTLTTVPHGLELVRAGRHDLGELPRLRQVTQAGGALPAARVRELAAQGARQGWELRVMYGQTEATARMAIATATDAHVRPGLVGAAIGGGRFEVLVDGAPAAPGTTGDLVFHGDNVMLGYAEHPADLALGRTVTALHTGDLARLDAQGRVEVVGRRSAFLKIAGLRIDTGAVERALAEAGLTAAVAGTDDRLEVLVEADPDGRAGGLAGAASGLPAHRVATAVLDGTLPRTPSGKVDRPVAAALFATLHTAVPGTGASVGTATHDPTVDPTSDPTLQHLVDVYRACLGRPDAGPDDTFVGLHGDSLSYVEVAVHLEEVIGTLPADWPSRTLRDLAAAPAPASPGSRWARVDTTVALRALAICAIVAGHTKVATLLGGAHVLLAVGGFNFARFAGALPTARERARAVGATVAKIAVPTAIWVGAVGLLAGTYSVANLFLVNWLVGPDTWTSHWRLWFIEALVWVLVAVTALLAVPRVQKWYAAAPFAVAATIASVGLVARLDVLDLTSPPGRGTAPAVLWLFAVGWAAALARSARQRLLLCAVLAVGLPGFMGNTVREWTIAAGILALVWFPNLPVPRAIVPAVGVLASSSLYIYLTHFEVYRLTSFAVVNLALSLGLGIATWLVVSRVSAALGRRRPASPAAYPTTPAHPVRTEGTR